MFTGIVEELGKVEFIAEGQLRIDAELSQKGLNLGSISALRDRVLVFGCPEPVKASHPSLMAAELVWMVNEYTRAWFAAFAEPIDGATTRTEVEGFTRWLPLHAYLRILDVCCGLGRHAMELTRIGYEVVGVDRDRDAIATATRLVPGVRFVQADQRTLEGVGGPFDGVLVLWQSFGYFGREENDAVLGLLASLLRPGGRLLLDVYHPGFWRDHQGVRDTPKEGVHSITDTVAGDRLSSRIEYTDGAVELMDFELIEPEDLAVRAGTVEFSVVDQCCWWDPQRAPDATEADIRASSRKHDSSEQSAGGV